MKILKRILFNFIILLLTIQSLTIISFSTDINLTSKIILGDIDCDGLITINDLAILKLHLIGCKVISEDNMLKASDLDKDNKITINDLAKLKSILLFDNSRYNSYLTETAKSFGTLEEAIKNNKVTKYQFTYQINNELKQVFEEKIGGKQLDYSKDRFYLVKNEKAFDKEKINEYDLSDKTFIFNPYRQVIIEVPEDYKLIKRKSTWYWRSSNDFNKKVEDDEEFQNDFFEKLVNNYEISDMYLHLGPSFFRNKHDSSSFNIEKLKIFVKNAYNHNIRIYCLIGDVSYLLDENIEKTIYNLMDDIEEYNNSVDVDQRIAGVSYDNEFWVKKKDSNGNVILDLEWKTNEETRKKHVEYIKKASDYAKEKQLDINFALPFNISRYFYTDEHGKIVNMYDEISKILEEPNLMIYRDSINKIYEYLNDVQTDAKESIIDISIKNGSSINIAIDVANHGESESGQTFYEEELENAGINGTVYNSLNKMDSIIKTNNNIDSFSFSIHHAEVLAKFQKGKK